MHGPMKVKFKGKICQLQNLGTVSKIFFPPIRSYALCPLRSAVRAVNVHAMNMKMSGNSA